MTQSGPTPFDFNALDGIAFAAERGRLAGRTLSAMVACDLGPVIELTQLAAIGLLPRPERLEALRLDGVRSLYRALIGGQSHWVCPDSRRMGLLRTRSHPPADLTIWTGFGLAVQQAAVAARFPKRVAAQLVAALGELHSNLYEHSGAPETGLVAFQAGMNRFEFVVADRGIGVRESLRNCAEYTSLQDHGEALRLSLTDGVSRHGPNVGRGHGFRPLFIGLANLNGALRFRSGDHALIIDGRSPSLLTARQAQKPTIKGFVASVICELRDAAEH
jgi:anti-sigma regulatory factor (Ser/Thr protein kinase)